MQISQKKNVKERSVLFIRIKKNLIFFFQYIFIYISIYIYIYSVRQKCISLFRMVGELWQNIASKPVNIGLFSLLLFTNKTKKQKTTKNSEWYKLSAQNHHPPLKDFYFGANCLKKVSPDAPKSFARGFGVLKSNKNQFLESSNTLY